MMDDDFTLCHFRLTVRLKTEGAKLLVQLGWFCTAKVTCAPASMWLVKLVKTHFKANRQNVEPQGHCQLYEFSTAADSRTGLTSVAFDARVPPALVRAGQAWWAKVRLYGHQSQWPLLYNLFASTRSNILNVLSNTPIPTYPLIQETIKEVDVCLFFLLD